MVGGGGFCVVVVGCGSANFVKPFFLFCLVSLFWYGGDGNKFIILVFRGLETFVVVVVVDVVDWWWW